jgi:hypothetical protein
MVGAASGSAAAYTCDTDRGLSGGGWRRHILGSGAVTVEVDQAVHVVADSKIGDAVAQPGHHAGYLVRRDDGRTAP